MSEVTRAARRRVRMSARRSPFQVYLRSYRYKGQTVVTPRWWIRFSVRGDDGKPCQVRINLQTEDEEEARRKAPEVFLKYRDNPCPAPASLTIGDFLEEYHRHLEATKAQKTAQNERLVLKRFFDACFPNRSARLREVTTNVISRHIDRRRTEEGIAPKTAYHIRQALSTMFNYAVRQKGFLENPATKVPRPKCSPGPIDYLKLGEIVELLKIVREEDALLYGPIATAILAGLRRSEVTWLTWKDVDLERKRLVIQFKTVHGERYRPKTNKSRIVPISADLFPILEALPKKHDWTFPSPEGCRWNTDNLSGRLRRLMKRHDWKHTFLTFRHTFGSQLAQKGLSLYQISKLMGNSEGICCDHYAALAVEEMHTEVGFLRQAAPTESKQVEM